MPDSDYPHLRDMLDDRFAALSDAELDSAFAEAFGDGVTPAEYEEFFAGLGKAVSSVAGDVGRFAQRAAPVAASAAQGALQGGAAGASFGPYGALIGALAGGTGAALRSHGTGAARDVGNVLGGVVGTAGALTGGAGGGLGGLLGGGRAPAAGQLMRLLGRPETSRALGALAGGRNAAVPVGSGGVPVPANVFAGLLSALAGASEAEAEDRAGYGDAAAGVPAYLVGPDGRLVADPTDPGQRAARLLVLLGEDDGDSEDYGDSEDSDSDDSDPDDSDPDDYGEFEDYDEFEEAEDFDADFAELIDSDGYRFVR